MTERFIEVMCNDEGNPEESITSTELIRVSDLIKMFKVCGDTGKGIAFVFYDKATNSVKDWRYECFSTYIRDCMWDRYLAQLNAVHGE